MQFKCILTKSITHYEVVKNYKHFSKLKLKHEFPDCYEKFKLFKKPDILYLAAIFHDIAKGRGGDHSELGALDAERFCKKINFPKEDSLMLGGNGSYSYTDLKSDISDPTIIHEFRDLVKTQTYLDALYLLTVADIRGTSPHVWNEWKATLLKNFILQLKYHLKKKVKQSSKSFLKERNGR